MSWSTLDPYKNGAVDLGHGVAYSWSRCDSSRTPDYSRLEHAAGEHTIDCLWIWHDCRQVLGPDTVAPGDTYGWRPSGVSAHTLVQIEPLTITASVYWPECCGMHGFVTDGTYRPV